MVNKKSLPREDRKHLREFLSFNPFFKEMEIHLHKMAYGKNGYSDEHLCLEQMWLLAIDFLHKSNLVYNDTGVLADPLLDISKYDTDTCHYLAVTKCYLMMVKAYHKQDCITHEEEAWKCVEQEFLRLDAAADPDLHDGEDFLLPGSGDWHLMYVHLIREMYFKRNVHFVFL